MLGKPIVLGAALALLLPASVHAHHSFAAFFESTKTISLKGKVTQFRFTNPHGTIALAVVGADGKTREWRIETNAPVVLMRRGWTRTSLKAGDELTVDGWPSRDGKPYLRLRSAKDSKGNLVGTAAFDQTDG